MVQFLLKRLIGLIFVVLCVSFITFIMGYLAPGDPIRNIMGNHFDPVTYHHLRHVYGLDLPWYQQYWNYLVNLAHGQFGTSFQFLGRPVASIVAESLPTSLELGFWGLFLAIITGVPLGVIAAIKANSWVDTVSMGFSLIFFATPAFILAIFAQVVILWFIKTLSIQWPVAGWGDTPWIYSLQNIQFRLVPILVLAAPGAAIYARLGRTSMLEVLRQDYVRTARAKGLREQVVIYQHALRNALIPLITVIGSNIGLLVTGVIFIEQIFNIPGIGTAGKIAIDTRDYPMIQATVMLGATAVVVGNLMSDILYTVVDPRIKVE